MNSQMLFQTFLFLYNRKCASGNAIFFTYGLAFIYGTAVIPNPFQTRKLFLLVSVKPKAVDDCKDAISEDRKSAIASHVTVSSLNFLLL